MTSLTIAIIVVFVVGYLFIALESVTKVNKAAVAFLMFVGCWTLFMCSPEIYLSGFNGHDLANQVSTIIEHHLGGTSTTLFFLMGAMTIVEIVDQNGGFNWVQSRISTKSKRSLLWKIAFMTFFLSAILDNLTTSIVMVMILRKLVFDKKDRLIYASLVIIAANSGGAFSPIGDVTTIMLWNKGSITALGVISEIFVPSLISLIVPTLILQYQLKGELGSEEAAVYDVRAGEMLEFNSLQRKVIFAIGVGGLMFVPVFKSITHLPPFVGILFVLGMLWTITEVFYRQLHRYHAGMTFQKRVTNLLSRIDMSTILFFLGILMVTGIIGVLSSIVDNVPLVAGCMGMYPIAPSGDMAVDGIFWQLLAYCAGVGGSILIIGSAAGVVVMGLEKITFGWYMKRITWIAFVGYLAGIVSYWVIRTFLITTPI